MIKNYFLLVLSLISFSAFAQSKLKTAKNNLKDNSNSYSSNTQSSSRNSSTSFWSDLLIKPIIWVGTNTIIGERQKRTFIPYPYFNNYSGEYSGNLNDGNNKSNLLKINSYYMNSFDGVSGINLNINYRFSHLIGATLNHIHFNETYFNTKEYLDITSLLFNYYRIREKNITAYWSLGASFIANEVNKTGFTYELGTELFLFNPISVNASWQQILVNRTSINSLKLDLGFYIKKAKLFVGYHNLNIAGVKNPSLAIGLSKRF